MIRSAPSLGHHVRRRATALRKAWRLLRQPIPTEKKSLLTSRWESLDRRWRILTQGYGRQATGCGATIGIHPRCDFACEGCYLGREANRIPRRPRDEIFRQLEALRAFLGPKGNVQITDGEVTLLPVEDLVAVLKKARELDLLPMVMTHGDSFRRRPGLLERLVADGGMTEVSIHVDTTQRGRLGYKGRTDEIALMPLREEFATMIRAARKATGVELRAAMTMTVTRDNLDGVPPVVVWCLRNRDVFGLISLLPLAHVGRTRDALLGVTTEELWSRIGGALRPYGFENREAARFLFGHPDCSRVELMIVYERAGDAPRIASVLPSLDEALLADFHARGLGGINFRDDSAIERVCRALGVAARHPSWVTGPARRWLVSLLHRFGTSALRLAWDLARGRARIGGFSIVSHHFMSRDEVASPIGRERLAACVFRVPVNGRMVSMCEINATGVREAFYAGRADERGVTSRACRPS
jgi:MoaA/NifB/PqqE/SkfB family radical SAM enzyme